MPELAEVARIVHHLRSNLRNQTVASVTFPKEDPIIFQTPKTDLTLDSFAKQLAGRTVLDAKQQGKYFWLVMDKPPHPLMHFGMTGWIRFRGKMGAGVDYKRMQDDKTRDKVKQEGGDAGVDAPADDYAKDGEEWPPRFWKFNIATTSDPPVDASFVDGRRLGRVRLIDCPADEIRNVSPLKENGPDPVVDRADFTLQFVTDLVRRRRVPIKSLLLDQGAISGIGNWLADEILYQAAIHPAVYANTLDDAQIKALHMQIETVCKTAVDVLADSSKFPADWLMKFRWDKGKKDANRLPNGDKIVHVEVGGRTSAVVPSRQKKSGSGAADNDEDEDEGQDGEEVEARKVKAPKGTKRGKQIDGSDEAQGPIKKTRRPSEVQTSAKKQASSKRATAAKKDAPAPATGSRRSSRRSGA